MKTLKNIIISALIGIMSLLQASSVKAQMSEYKFKQLFDQGFGLILDGEYQEAYPVFEQLYKSDSNHGQVQYLFALCEIKTSGTRTSTVSYLKKAVNKADFYHQSGRVEDRSAPVKAWYYLAMCYASSNRYVEAIESYRNYMSFIPMASLAHKRMVVKRIQLLKEQQLALSHSSSVPSTYINAKP